MFLFHVTTEKSLKSILKDGYIKSLLQLQNEGYKIEPNEGSGIYETTNFIYFSCIDKINTREIYGQCIMYFNSKILYNRMFYVSTCHSGYPNSLGEWTTGNESREYKRKYYKKYIYYDEVLQKLFNNSISKLPNGKAFQIFQQIAIRKKLSLKNLVAIEFNRKPKTNIIKYIQKKYPNITIYQNYK